MSEPLMPTELAALIATLQRWKEVFDENFFVTDHPDDARQFADAMLSFLPRILAALTQAREDREEVGRLKRTLEWSDNYAAFLRLQAENEALVKLVPKIPEYHSVYPDDKDIARCNYDCGVTVGMLRAQMAEESTNRTAAAKEGT